MTERLSPSTMEVLRWKGCLKFNPERDEALSLSAIRRRTHFYAERGPATVIGCVRRCVVICMFGHFVQSPCPDPPIFRNQRHDDPLSPFRPPSPNPARNDSTLSQTTSAWPQPVNRLPERSNPRRTISNPAPASSHPSPRHHSRAPHAPWRPNRSSSPRPSPA